MEAEITALKGEIVSVSKLMEQTYAVLNEGGPVKFVTQKLTELDSRQKELMQALAAKEAEKSSFEAREERFLSSREEINGLVVQLQGAPTPDIYKLRAQIASRLRVLVETLIIAPQGDKPRLDISIEKLRALTDGPDEDVMGHISDLAEHPEQARRYFAIGFKDAAVRIVYPTYNDPLNYQHQIKAGNDGIQRIASAVPEAE
jgi:hypothetical protein